MGRVAGGAILRGLCAVALAAGCSGETSRPSGESVSPGAPTEAAPTAAPADRRAAKPQADAADAVNAVFDGLRNDRPQAVWEFLPASYQRDVNRLVREFAERMDPVVWDRGVETVRRAVRLLDTHRELILHTPALAGNAAGAAAPPPEALTELRAKWGGTHALLALLVDSELADLERLKEFDGGEFLAGTGRRRLAQSDALSEALGIEALDAGRKERLAGAAAELVSSSAEGAMVAIAGPHGEIEEVSFVLVEGKWIPRALRDGWPERIGLLRRQAVEEFPATVERNRETILRRFETISAILARLEAAQSTAEFQAAVVAAMPEAVAMLKEIGVLPEPPLLDAPEGDEVVVLVRPAPDRALEEELQIRLSEASDDEEQGAAIPVRTPEGTRYDVSPVRDVVAYAKRLDFVRVVEVDPQQRRIVIELPAADPGEPTNPEPDKSGDPR
ncbi:MAG: hypothetical protein WED34_12910 [Planctomycetales bacterium]